MYDNGWSTQFTEIDIVEEGDVPLLMSLPQMRISWVPIRTYSREGLFVLCTYWHERNGLEDSQ